MREQRRKRSMERCRRDVHGVSLAGRHAVDRLVPLHLGHVQRGRAGYQGAVGLRPRHEAAALQRDRHGVRWVGHVVERLAVAHIPSQD